MIATRQNPRTGRTEYRAYPQGRAHEDGGTGAWYADRAQAETVHAAALAADAEIAATTAAREAIAACTAGAGAIAHGNRNRALDALFELLTTRQDGEQLTALATDADLVNIVRGRQTIAYVNARRR